jgi:hypothetical protein
MKYTLAAEGEALAAVMTATKAEKAYVAQIFRQLMTNPFQAGETERLNGGRELQVKRFGKWLVTFWTDHAVKEVRVVALVKLIA